MSSTTVTYRNLSTASKSILGTVSIVTVAFAVMAASMAYILISAFVKFAIAAISMTPGI